MQPNNPGHISINQRRVKVQNWQLLPGRIALTVLIHGDQSGRELQEQLSGSDLTLEFEGQPPLNVRPELTRHSVVGSGPKAVHRIQAQLWLPQAEPKDESLEAKVDRLQMELAQLRAEVAELKAARPAPRPTGLRQSLHAGQTMIDTEIDTSESNDA